MAGVRVGTGRGQVRPEVGPGAREAGHREVVVAVGAGVGAVGGGRVAGEGGQGVARPRQSHPVGLHHCVVPGQGQVTASHGAVTINLTDKAVSFPLWLQTLDGYNLVTADSLAVSGAGGRLR